MPSIVPSKRATSHSPASICLLTATSDQYRTVALDLSLPSRQMLRDERARPSDSRTIGQATISVPGSRSRAIRRITFFCCASLLPKKEVSGRTIYRSFRTTVVTPRKCPGRERPSNTRLNLRPSPMLKIPSDIFLRQWEQIGSRRLCSRPLDGLPRGAGGYFAKSSEGPNCAGFAKMETATAEHRFCASLIREK